ncbi:MAG: glucose-6-phosphate isomerase family protein [Candidatus Micrarchaeota archaeon]
MKIECWPCDLEYDDEMQAYSQGLKLEGTPRTLSEMRIVGWDKEFFSQVDLNQLNYFVYRHSERGEDEKLFKAKGLGFDLTVIPPWHLGLEFNKTLGHYHPNAPNGKPFPEVYEVLQGEPCMLMQRRIGDTDEVDEVRLFKLKPRDKIVVPAGYGHFSINPTPETVVLANIVAEFKSEYDAIRRKEGAAFFFLTDGRILANEKYEKELAIREWGVHELDENRALAGENMYMQFLEKPEKFDFLLGL